MSLQRNDYPRLCRLKRWPDFGGYGFNLHAEKGKPGQYIGSVDANSPAENGGLKANDRVVEVNGVNVCNENHQQVVSRIRELAGEVTLLVITSEGERICAQNGQVASNKHPNVLEITCNEHNPYTNKAAVETQPSPQTAQPVVQPVAQPVATPQTAYPTNQQPVEANNYNGNSHPTSQTDPDLDNMTAAELRQKLASKKRANVKSDGTFHDKAKIFQQL